MASTVGPSVRLAVSSAGCASEEATSSPPRDQRQNAGPCEGTTSACPDPSTAPVVSSRAE